MATLLGSAGNSSSEVILQFFNNTWNEITDKMPEIAEVGYHSLWLPPPQKAGGDLSVGYDLWDPFDLGGQTQRTGGRTRYGTEAELQNLMQAAHRFGIRVYFDNIMNHRAFDIPGYNENTPIDIYPGMLPEDFHLRVTEDGFYRAWPDTVNWGSTWDVQNLFLSGLIDIAHESPNGNFGAALGYTHPKITFVRHPGHPEYYDYHPTLGLVGFGNSNITAAVISNNPGFYTEDVGGYLMRSVRWLMDRTKADGLRLDAVKHVPAYFFGEQWAAGKDTNSAGYCGQAQLQYNRTRGFSDPNHRDTVFDTEPPRDDAMMFGEHMGNPPPYEDYFASGMRLVDAKIHSTLNERLGNTNATLNDLQYDGQVKYGDHYVQFGAYLGVAYAKSHDDGIANREELHYAINLTRRGLPNVYTDGNRHAETLGDSGGAFPRHANTKPFGQFKDNRIPNLVYIHNHFARGEQTPRSTDNDVLAFERRDKRENWSMTEGDANTLLMMINDNYNQGQYREIPTAFPEGARLWQYADSAYSFYTTVTNGTVRAIVPPGGYFAFSWRSPEETRLWSSAGGRPMQIYQNGEEPGWVSYVRRDGPDGDPAFNPYRVADPASNDFAYSYYVPRVSSATNLRFAARVDGSAYNVMMKLDGGINLNTNTHSGGDPRDNPPALSTDVYLGYEQASYVKRIWGEKFAAVDSARNKIGSGGAESYFLTIGSGGVSHAPSSAQNDWDGSTTVSWIYHDPSAMQDGPRAGNAQFWPPASNAANSTLYLGIKTPKVNGNRLFLYYTTNGMSWPEGAGGEGANSATKVVEANWVGDGAGSNDWWEAVVPAMPAGTVFRYKVGSAREQGYNGNGYDVVWPGSDYDINRKGNLMGLWQVTNFNAATVAYRPHMDYGLTATGLVEGFHTISARAFLQREGAAEGNGKRAAIYNTFQQTFYLDTKAPEGEIKYPVESETLYDNRYGVVVRTDPTVSEVWYNISDANALNDDGQTEQSFGNGTNSAGQTSWVKATRVSPSVTIPSSFPAEWRFNYNNVATGSTATIRVKLAEISSSTNPLLADADGHFRTLTRTVNARGPDYSLFVGWPQRDGETIGVPYNMKVYFSQALWNADEETVRNRFLITIDGTAQGRDGYDLNWQAGPNGLHELAFNLPDMYNGDPNYLHEIAITHTNAAGGGVTLFASRIAKAARSSTGPVVTIMDPPEFDLNGAAYQIVLPDVPNPTSTQRQYMIRVQTDTAAKQVWIDFTNSVGYATAVAGSTNQLTGTVTVAAGSAQLVGAGTLFAEQVTAGSILRISTNLVMVSKVDSHTNLTLREDYPGPAVAGVPAYLVTGNPLRNGSKLYWNFLWSNLQQGAYTILAKVDTNNNQATVEAQATRNTRVVFKDQVPENDADYDDDDDGLFDTPELVSTNLPGTNPETWNNGNVHIWRAYGRTDPQLPDTDGDGLPDGLEVGWRGADTSNTDTNKDTNGDGFKNFRSDIDPPFFNTVPDNWDVPNYNFNDSRTKLIAGSMTDPNNPDTDGDGLPDGLEDRNRNGWVDGDGRYLLANEPKSARPLAGDWPDGKIQSWETWQESDPNNSDTDGDGASDGLGEDTNLNGWIDGDTNSNRVWNAGELWQETNPLKADTDGDGLPDGWETRYGLDPFDNGVIGQINLRTGGAITSTTHGAQGNPDGDLQVVGNATNAYNNLLEFQNNTHPFVADTSEVSPGGLRIGRGNLLGVLGGVTNYQEFADWTADDCMALDEYEGVGSNDDNGDVYPGWIGDGQTDGLDTSRDIVAFYRRDGGNADGKFYFRLDFLDLQPFAEDNSLDIYVVVDTGQPGLGEYNLPDEVDLTTDMRWELVVAAYKGGQGAVYVDTDHNNNTTFAGQALNASVGVQRRDQTATHGFIDSYYNSEMDAVEMAISRQALIDAGWNGLNPDTLNFQVFVTKDGTCNACVGGKAGAGDLRWNNQERSDVRDTILDDYLAEDKWDRQQGMQHVLKSWITGTTRAGRAKMAMIVHGNQAIQPGSVVQQLMNNGANGGYYRPLDVHQLYRLPLNLHVTPTLASALEWAKADPAGPRPWLDGPAFNNWIAQLVRTNVVKLMASTFSDHMLPYFTADQVEDNAKLAREFLETIYETPITSNSVFWAPERLLDHDVFTKIAGAKYRATVLDQTEHLVEWFGRTEALGTRGYQMNRISGVITFAINNGAADFRFQNSDNGLNLALRRLFNRKARSDQDQVTTLFSNWEDFGNAVNANAYDVNMRWIANHPWIQVVALEDILKDQVDLNNDGFGDPWYVQERGNISSAAGQTKVSHNYINYSTQLNYDQWYNGSAQEEGLLNKKFEIRPGVQVPTSYGMLYTGGVASQSWREVTSIADSNVAKLGKSVFHASVFQTAFHNQNTVDLSKYSDGRYIAPDTTTNVLAGFSKAAQSQTRMAAVQERVDDWLDVAPGLTNTQSAAEDVDLDGESEHLLFNDRLFGLFERSGGRLVGAWVRDIMTGRAYQALGNPVSYAGSETENEGSFNVYSNGTVEAYRTSGLKDWWAGTGLYVNDLYTFVSVANGWRATSANGSIQKTITLHPGAWKFEVAYQLSGGLAGQTIYVRHGLSPNLYDLLLRGQQNLGGEILAGGVMSLANTNYETKVTASVGYADAGHNASFNAAATDDGSGPADFATMQRRNQAQTHQVEISGTGNFTFSLGFRAEPSDWDGDGIPNIVEDGYGMNSSNASDGNSDMDSDGMKAWQEYVAGTAPNNGSDYLRATHQIRTNNGFTVRFPTSAQREYQIWYANQSLGAPAWTPAFTNKLRGTGGTMEWTDNGTQTTPHPASVTNRYYRIDVSMPN